MSSYCLLTFSLPLTTDGIYFQSGHLSSRPMCLDIIGRWRNSSLLLIILPMSLCPFPVLPFPFWAREIQVKYYSSGTVRGSCWLFIWCFLWLSEGFSVMQAKIVTSTRSSQHHCHFLLCPGPDPLGVFSKCPNGGVTISMLPNVLPAAMHLKTEAVPSPALRMRTVFLWPHFWRKTAPFISFLSFLSCLQWSKSTVSRWHLKTHFHSSATGRLMQIVPWLSHRCILEMFSIFVAGFSFRIQTNPACGNGFIRSRCWDETGHFSGGL